MGNSDRLEWLRWRQQGIGGSDAAAIVGLDPFKSAMSVWLSKVSAVEDQAPDRDGPMHWGKLLEPLVIEQFEERSELIVTDRQVRVERPDWPIMRATLDGLVRDPEQTEVDPVTHNSVYHPLGLYEGKTASRGSDAWANGVPDHVQVQVQHQLAVTGHGQAWVAALLLAPTPRLEIYTLDRDEDAIAGLVESEAAFWELVQERRPPAADGSWATSDALRRAFSEPTGATVELDAEQAQLVQTYIEARASEAEFARIRYAAEQNLMGIMGDAVRAAVNGQEVVTWLPLKQNRIDLDTLRAKHPKIVAAHTKTTTTRRFLVKSLFKKGA